MSNDCYQEIRDALAKGPTPGPWSVRYDYVVQAKSFDEGRLVPIAQPYGLRIDGSDLFANARLIAACDPDTIRELLAERDQLAAALVSAREDAERWRQAFVNERASRYRADGMKVEQARIHAETDAVVAAIDQARGKGGCGEGVA